MTNNHSRRDFMKASILGAASLATAHTGWGSNTPGEQLFFVGTYASANRDGIYLYSLNMKTGELSAVNTTSGIANPSFLAIAPNKQYLYAVNESSGGAISAFAINPKSKALTHLNQQPSHGGAPCYVSVDDSSKWVLIANYSGGNAAAYPVLEDGKLGPATSNIQHKGSSVNPSRQKGPHAHSIVLSPDNKFAFVADLGLDKVMIYRLQEGKLIANDTPWIQTKPGAGPRHFTFHPNGKLAFLINELDCTLSSYSYNAGNGTLQEIQTVSSLPADFSGSNSCADVHVHPSGKFLYGSNRGHDSIVAFSLSDEGKMSYIEHESTQGKTPRNFNIDPTGAFLLAANQDSSNVVSYWIDKTTGKLEPTGHQARISKPVCLKFYQETGPQQSAVKIQP